DEERDYMYRAYADDPRARVNLGIRRRLAPLLRDDRRKVELMNGLLLSLPGTPIIYYGDEIRMGDNIYLGDRDSVRTPMQWNDDRNSGFSRVNPQRLYLPVIIDAPYHYASRNVEVEQGRPHSSLWWMRRLINLRQQNPAFGRGQIEFLAPDNSKVLAFLREYEDETILVVANLSRHVQCAEIDLSRFRGRTPTELSGQTRFPAIGELPYFLTLGPYAFYWFRLEWTRDEEKSQHVELPSCKVKSLWDELFEGKNLSKLESALPTYLSRHRWFAGKARTIQQTKLVDVLTVHDVPEVTENLKRSHAFPKDLPATRLLLIQVEYVEGEPENYVLPLVFAQHEQEHNLLGDRPGAGVINVTKTDSDETASLCDTTHEPELWGLLFDAIAKGTKIPGKHGEVHTFQLESFADLSKNLSMETSVHGGEQSNTSAIIGRQLILKLFRRVDKGENPDLEIGRYLTRKAQLKCVPRLAGGLEYHSKKTGDFTLALLHEFTPNEGDAWVYTLDELGRYLERIESEASGSPPPEILPQGSLVELVDQDVPSVVQEMIGSYLESTKRLGQRTAELHLALAEGTDEAFAPEAFSKLYQRSLYQSMRAQARRTLSLLRKQSKKLAEPLGSLAQILLASEEVLLERYKDVSESTIKAQRTRTHGDFHLGQVLFTGKDFVIIDFEGEPDRTIGERRIKNSPLKDVAGMIRSFHYASHAAFRGAARQTVLSSESQSKIAEWLKGWFIWSTVSYLKAYQSIASAGTFLPEKHENWETLLNAYLLEKAVYELGYELNNRPDWVQIPLEGILHLIETK
ncbi:MAG: putative maltokinase, partial [Planctomycetaceae bacterium]|nr:putative maltokinase [Planctomycetaceae bacterium]